MFKKKRQVLRRGYLVLCLVLFAGVLYAAGQQSASYKIPADVINSGGAPSSSASYSNDGSLGQSSPLGNSLSASYDDYPGFWQANFCIEDFDSDGLDNCMELAYGSSLSNPDTDGDALTDGEEVNTYGTSPTNPDTDSDLMPDGWEVLHSLNPLVNDASLDPDGDGISNLDEYLNGLDPQVPNWGTINVSSDPSGAEVYLDGTLLYPGQYQGLSGPVGSPLSLTSLKNTKHTITIVKANYFTYQTYLNVTLGQTYAVNAPLVYRVLEFFTESSPVLADGHTVQAPGGFAAPNIADLDRNGTKDLLLGIGNGQVIYYQNASSTSLNLLAGATIKIGSVPLNVGARAKPFLVDWNNDNCPDLLVGNSVGKVFLFPGTGNCSGTFSAGSPLIVDGSSVLVPAGNAAPWVVDWNGDRAKDLIVGASDGRLYLFLNTGTDRSPILDAPLVITDHQGNEINAGSDSVPVAWDMDREGHLDLGVGGGDGQIGLAFYSTEDGPGLGFTYPLGAIQKNDVVTTVDVGDDAALSAGDINGDLQLDVMIGNAAGRVYYYPSSHLIGDIDRSGKVDSGDLILLKLSLGLCKGDAGYNPGADLNGDNCVSASDETLLLNNFGVTY